MCTEAIGKVFDGPADGSRGAASPTEIVAGLEREVLALSEKKSGAAEIHVKELVVENLRRLEEYHRGAAQITGLTIGLPYVDKVTGGLGVRTGISSWWRRGRAWARRVWVWIFVCTWRWMGCGTPSFRRK